MSTASDDGNAPPAGGAATPDAPPDMLAAALLYASKGFRVFPLHTAHNGKCSCRRDDCERIAKHPRTKNGLKDAVTDEAKIRDWWSMWPEANIGITFSKGQMAVDIDPAKGGNESWDTLCDGKDKLPDTPISHTGGGGRHLIFTTTTAVPNSVGAIGAGLDIRGEGGYIVAPPSMHASGKRYVWELSSDIATVDPAPVPLWLLMACIAKQAQQQKRKRATEDKGTDGPIPEGKRNDALFRVGRSLRAKGLSEDVILQALLALNLEKCQPPLDPKEVEAIAHSVCSVQAGQSEEFKHSKSTASRIRDVRPDANDYKPPVLMLGDDMDLALAALTQLREDSPERIIGDRRDFWRYSGNVWNPIHDDVVYATIAAYSGIEVNDKPLRISNGTAEGSTKAAYRLASRPDFFNEAPVGIAFQNGFVTVKDGKISLLPHSSEHRALHMMPFDYIADAKCPLWEWFLQEAFVVDSEEGEDNEKVREKVKDKDKTIALLQEHAGACLVGDAVKYHTALFLIGEGANGKSTYIEVLKRLFPGGALQAIAPQLWEKRFYLAELAGARLNAVMELPAKEFVETELFKAIISGEQTMVDRKNQRPFLLKPIAGQVFAANALPETRDQSEGFFRRCMVVKFNRSFTAEQADVNLTEKLFAEIPAVATWAMAGAARLQVRGYYDLPRSSIDAKTEWKLDSDQVKQFVKEALELLKNPQKNEGTSPTALYYAYKGWADLRGHAQLSGQKFFKRLRSLVPQNRLSNTRLYAASVKPRMDWEP